MTDRPKCKLCGLEDGACICAHLPPRLSAGSAVAADLIEDLQWVRQRVRNCRGAIESNQVEDKDVRGSLLRITDRLDDIITRLSIPVPAQPPSKHSPDECGRECEYYDFFEMLWKWFSDESRNGAEDMRSNMPDGLSAADFEEMLDEHEAALVNQIEVLEHKLAAQPPAAPVATILEECEDLQGRTVQTVRLVDGREEVRTLPRISAATVPARETVARILAHKMPSLRMADDTPGKYAHSIANEIVAALTSEPQEAWTPVALGDLVYMNERSPYFHDWKGVTLKVVSISLDPEGKRWVSVIEGKPHHRGYGFYDAETTGIDAEHLSPFSRPHQASTCEHDWKIWPETDGQEQRCMKCGEYRRTPRGEE